MHQHESSWLPAAALGLCGLMALLSYRCRRQQGSRLQPDQPTAGLGIWGGLLQHGSRSLPPFARAQHQTPARVLVYGAIEAGGAVAIAVFLSTARRR